MRAYLAGLVAVLCWGMSAQARPSLYDQKNTYENPLRGQGEDCAAVVELYRVYRPVFPGVNHVFIGARVRSRCPGAPFAVYGAPKGDADLEFFTEGQGEMEYLGQAQGEDAVRVLAAAAQVSLKWQHWLNHEAYLYSRIAATPLMGRPCAAAANDVVEAVQPYLRFSDDVADCAERLRAF